MNGLETILDRCLDDLLEGATPVECAERFPRYREELLALLETAQTLTQLPREQPRSSAVRTTLVRAGALMARPEWSEPAQASRGDRGGRVLPFLRSRPMRRLAAGFAAILLVGVLGGASADTVPGDLFYPVKLVKEKVTFALTLRPDHRAELRLTFADRRLEELLAMAGDGGEVDPQLVRSLLDEGALALQDAQPLPERRLQVFLKKLEHFNRYQQTVLEGLEPRVREGQRPLIRRAIETCDARSRWTRRTPPGAVKDSPLPRGSCWDECGQD